MKAKARLVIQGQHCLDNAQSSVKTDAPTVHRTAVSVFVRVVASMGWCRSLRFPEAFLEENFLDCPILRVVGGKNFVTLSKKTRGNLSCWTLPSSTCVTFLGISSE